MNRKLRLSREISLFHTELKAWDTTQLGRKDIQFRCTGIQIDRAKQRQTFVNSLSSLGLKAKLVH